MVAPAPHSPKPLSLIPATAPLAPDLSPSAASLAAATQVLERAVEEEHHKALVRRFVDALWNGADLDVADELFAEDCIPHALQYGATDGAAALAGRSGPKHVKLIVAGWRAAYPDWHMTINELIADGDKVVMISTGTGTHRGAIMGISATGKPVTFTGARVFRFAGGKIAEYWALWDWQGLWTQLGTRPRSFAG